MSEHPDLRSLLEGTPSDPAIRRELLMHLLGCARCRTILADREPERLFSLLALDTVPDGILDRVSEGVSAGIATEADRRRPRRLLAWGSLAASLMLAAALGTYLWNGTAREPAPPAPVARVERLDKEPAGPNVPASMIELLDSPGEAEVVGVTVGETELVMIFDEALDI